MEITLIRPQLGEDYLEIQEQTRLETIKIKLEEECLATLVVLAPPTIHQVKEKTFFAKTYNLF